MARILCLSYGKDSLACLEACMLLGYPVDRVIHAEVWATDTIPAELPPMIEFKAKADRIIKERYGLTVEHITAESDLSILSYERMFYTVPKNRKDPRYEGKPTGFPMLRKPWCNSKLKVNILTKLAFLIAPLHKELTQILCNISV